MKKYLVGYCYSCRKKMKHEIIRCTMPFAARLFLGIASAGISEITGQQYECECIKCGDIRKIST